jgi:hypothetical protein
MLVNTASTERMRITSTGLVGIGTSGPATFVEINRLFSTGSTQTDYLRLTASQGGAWFSRMGLQFRWNDFGNGAAFNLASVEGQVDGWNGTNSGGGALLFLTKTSGAYATDPTEKMRITAAGNVGIGTTSPAAPLHVVGNEYIAKSGGGGTYKQTVVGQTTAAASGTAKKIAYVGYTNSVRVYVWANQSTAHGSSAIADITTLYGFSTGGTTTEANYGNVSDIVVAYNNGGSPAYTIDVTLTYSGTAPTINYVIEGISWDNNIYTL